MPCKPCENGKWKFGRTGKCEYDSKSECESANADYYSEEKKKYYSEHDHHFNFTKEQMEELHENGKLEVTVSDGDQEMVILFTYDQEDLQDLLNKSKEITNKYKRRYGH